MSAPTPANEAERLAALRAYDVLDTEPELAYDDLVRLASSICETPIAAITFLDEDRQWLKASIGMPGDCGPREDSFCTYAILSHETLIVEDASSDPRFHDNPSVTGSPRIRFYAGAPLVNPEGLAVGALCVVSPTPKTLTSDQQAALEALARQVVAQLELKRTIKQLESQTDELSEALERAEASRKAKQAFLASMSHELRTPLNGLIGMADLLGTTPMTGKQSKYVETIRKSSHHLLEILAGILEFSEYQGGQIELSPAPAELVRVVRELADLMQPAAIAKGIHLSWSVDSALHSPLVVDVLRVRQVLTNLIANAIKFTESGSVEIRAREVDWNEHSIRVRFEVEDTGIGIPLDRQQAIFDEFVQGEEGPSRSYGGTGLGLSVSRGVVERMGGFLSVTSTIGKGSTFSFELELERAAEADQRTHRVLVVEDNEVNTIVITAMLEQKGCRVEHAANGVEALRMLTDERFDMIFMDLQMPEMDGVTATREVRARETTSDRVPIVAVTASAMEEDENICREAGMDGLIRKPINERIIAEALERFLA